MKIYAFILLALILIPFRFAFSQQGISSDENTEPEITITDHASFLYEDDAVFIINSIDFHITGITRRSALLDKGEINRGDEIKGYSNIEEYIKDRQQLLYNQRALQSAFIEYNVGQKNTDGKYPVDLYITTTDSWNLIAFPRPYYSTNSGIKLTLNMRDYNFLGTLTPLRLDIGFKHDLEGRNYYSFMLDTNIPFRLLNVNWNFIFINDFEYRPRFDQPFYYKNTTGFSVDLPFGETVFTVGFNESLYLNREHDDKYKEHYGDTQKGLYLSSNPSVEWEIPTGIEINQLGQIFYTSNFNAVIPHSLSPWSLTTECEDNHVHDLLAFPSLHFGHSLGLGRIDWKENFKSGFSVNISNSFSYYFREKHYNTQPWDSNLQLNVTGHQIIIVDLFGFSGRFLYRHWFFGTINEEAGDVLRGIPDDNVHANFMLSVNLDFPVKVLTFKPAQWFGVDFFKYFHFDLFLSPTFDIAFFHHPDHQTSISLNNLIFSGGIEIIAFPHIMRSIQLRIGAGYNLSHRKLSSNTINSGYNPSTAGKYEIYIGTDFHL